MDKLKGWHVNWMHMHGIILGFISCSCPSALYVRFLLFFPCRQDLALSAMFSASLNTRSLPAELQEIRRLHARSVGGFLQEINQLLVIYLVRVRL